MKKKLFKGTWGDPGEDGKLPKKPNFFYDDAIGKRLKIFRKTGCNMTMAKLMDKIDVSQGSLSDLENGHSLPSANTLRELYYAGCDITWLITGEDR